MSRKAARKVSSAAAARGSQHWAALHRTRCSRRRRRRCAQGQHRMPADLTCNPCASTPVVPGATAREAAAAWWWIILRQHKVDALREIADRGMALGGGAGGPTILTTPVLWLGDKFVDVWSVFNATPEAVRSAAAARGVRLGRQACRRASEAQFGATSALHLHRQHSSRASQARSRPSRSTMSTGTRTSTSSSMARSCSPRCSTSPTPEPTLKAGPSSSCREALPARAVRTRRAARWPSRPALRCSRSGDGSCSSRQGASILIASPASHPARASPSRSHSPATKAPRSPTSSRGRFQGDASHVLCTRLARVGRE